MIDHFVACRFSENNVKMLIKMRQKYLLNCKMNDANLNNRWGLPHHKFSRFKNGKNKGIDGEKKSWKSLWEMALQGPRIYPAPSPMMCSKENCNYCGYSTWRDQNSSIKSLKWEDKKWKAKVQLILCCLQVRGRKVRSKRHLANRSAKSLVKIHSEMINAAEHGWWGVEMLVWCI